MKIPIKNFSHAGGRWFFVAAVSLLLAWTSVADFQGSTHMMPFDEGAINYNKAKEDNPVTRLQSALDCGKTKLKYDRDFGYALSVLEKLKVPRSSQMLVFSKTSFQRERISPHSPRALFFNDDIYVGFIPGSPLMEVSVADPNLGGVFYTLDQSEIKKPKFVRTDQCLECHASAKSMGVPGHLLRSFVTDETGVVDLSTGISEVNHRTPMEDRWGGWYVSGTHGKQTHHGNLIGADAFKKNEKKPNYLGNLSSLTRFFDVKKYPEANSDIVALMVLEHQVHMHNFLTRLHYESTLMLAQYGHVNYLNNIVDAFLKYLLFTEEAPITSPIRGASSFTKDFEALGSCDKQGRSLRQLDLQTRLLKYPCSYLIYSQSFDALPPPLKEKIYQRLWEILRGQDSNPDFARLSPETRRAILEILTETKNDLPSFWSHKN